MEEPDLSDSVEDDQLDKMHDNIATNDDSDSPYSDSDSEENADKMKSMFNVHKFGHVPGKYKENISKENKKSDDSSATGDITTDDSKMDKNEDKEASEEILEEKTMEGETDLKDEQVLKQEKDEDFAETGIFGKSMLIVPSLPKDEYMTDDTISGEVPKQQEPTTLTADNESLDGVKKRTKPDIPPKPTVRKSKCINKDISPIKQLKETDERKSPLSSPIMIRKSDGENPSNGTKKELEHSQIHSESNEHVLDEKNTPEKDPMDKHDGVAEEEVDTVDIGSAKDCALYGEENDDKYFENNQEHVEEKQETLVPDGDEKADSQFQKSIALTSFEVVEDVESTDKEVKNTELLEDSDSEVENTSNFVNDLKDTDSGKSDADQNMSESEPEGEFQTPENQSLEEKEKEIFYDSIPVQSAFDEPTLNEVYENPIQEEEEVGDQRTEIREVKNEEETANVKSKIKSFEESVLVIGKGTIKDSEYKSMSSMVNSDDLKSSPLINDGHDTHPKEIKLGSFVNRISMFEKQASEEQDLSSYDFVKTRKSFSSSSSIDVLTREESEDDISTSADDILLEETHDVISEDIEKNAETNSSEQDDMLEREEDPSENDKPPPIAEKSEIVLESMKSMFVDVPYEEEKSAETSVIGMKDGSSDAEQVSERNFTDQNYTCDVNPSTDTFSYQQSLPYQQQQQTQPYPNMQYNQQQGPFQQQQQPFQPNNNPVWNQPYNYYPNQGGNFQYPYAFCNPNMNPGLAYQNPNMQYYQQPYFPYQNNGMPFRYMPPTDAEQYRSLSPSTSTTPEETGHQTQMENLTPTVDNTHKRPKSPHAAHHNEASHQTKSTQQPSGVQHGRSKLKKSKSDVTKDKDSSPAVKRSVTMPTKHTPVGKKTSGQKKDIERKIQTQKEEEEEEYNREEKKEDYYIYFKDINPDTKPDNLSNFIEASTGGDVLGDKIIFNYTRTCALVTVELDHKLDLHKVKDRIQKKGLEGKHPEVYEVPKPTKLAVSCEDDIKSRDNLDLYFESSKAQGNKPLNLQGDSYESEDGSCFVLDFGDTEVIKRICSKEMHTVEKKTLRVSPYFECEGGAIWNTDIHVLTVPESIPVPLQSSYLTLLKRECCAELVDSLKRNNCSVKFTDTEIQIDCTLTPKMTGFKGLAKKWGETSTSIVDEYISENIIERRFRSTEPAWNELLEFFNSENIKGDEEEVTVINSVDFEILLIGFKEPVNDALKRLQDKQGDIEKQQRRTTGRITDYNKLKLSLLKMVGVFDDLKHNLQDIEINIEGAILIVEGQPEDIDEVRLQMYDLENQISHKQWIHQFSPECVFFVKNVLPDQICSLLKRESISAVWEMDEKVFDVYAFENAVNDYEVMGEDSIGSEVCLRAEQLLKSVVFEEKEPVQDSIIEVLTSPEWISFSQHITETYEKAAELEVKDDREILVHGLRKEARKVYTSMKDFLDKNAILSDTIKTGTVNIRFIKTHRLDFVKRTEQELEENKVKIELGDDFIKIRGNKRGITEAKKKFMTFFNAILHEKFTIEKVAVKNVFIDQNEKGTIEKIEKDTSCLIKIPGENATFIAPGEIVYGQDNSDDEFCEVIPRGGATGSAQDAYGASAEASQPQCFKAKNGVKVILVKGELGQQDIGGSTQVLTFTQIISRLKGHLEISRTQYKKIPFKLHYLDKGNVIVVTTAPNLNLSSGNACKSVLREGGPQLQDECKAKYPNEIKFGEIAVINGGGKLECNKVYLTTLPNWNSEHNPEQVLEKVMKDSLELVDKHKKYSIVFCAMGTGQLQYPVEMVAKVMYQAVVNFDQGHPQSSLKEVKFVLYQKDYATIKAFEKEETFRLSGAERPIFELKTGKVTIELLIENIAQQKVDGILCSTSPNMDLNRSGACQALVRMGGKSLQEECKSKYGNKLEEGNVVEIGGGKLACNSVYLTVLPAYNADNSDAIKILTKVIQTLLQLAHAKGYKTLALPALGTGFLRYPKEEVCQCMFQAVIDWVQKNSGCSITTVKFIMYAKDHEVIDRFKTYIYNERGRGRRENRRSYSESKQQDARPKKTMFDRAPKKPQAAFFNAHSDGVHIGKIKLSVFKDDILSQKTDAIVSSVGKDFQFIGAVAHELKKKCPKIEEECKKPESVLKLNNKFVVVTKGYTLQPKHVIHVKFAENIGDWQQRIFKCLEAANKKSFKSIAFPVLGTGKGFKMFSPEAITGCMFDAVNEFAQKTKSPTVKTILLIVYHGQPGMYTPIMDKLHKKVQEAITIGPGGFSWDSGKGMVKAAVGAVGKLKRKVMSVATGREEGTISEKEMHTLLQDSSSLDLLIYSDSKSNIERCKKELQLKLEESYRKDKINDYTDIIKTLTPDESDQLEITALADIKIDPNAGIVTIEGPAKHVSEVIHQLKMRLLKIQRHRNDAASAEELFKLVQWQYEEVTDKGFEYKLYDKGLNMKIEEEYKANRSTFEFQDNDGKTFVIDFNKLIEYDKTDDQDRLRVVRKDILKAVASALPDTWADMKDNENIKVVQVPNTDKEYQDIETRFTTEVKTGSYSHRLNFDPNNLKVNKIERIQNRTLYQQYQAKKNQMKELKPNLASTMPYERDLWHGTKQDAVTSIQMHGFNRSYSGNANGEPWYGEGVYFAGNASYSARGWLSGAGAGSKGYMFVVKTLTGQLCQGKKGMRYLPQVNPKDPTILYDCAVDNLQTPLEFVIFNDTQAYPAYIITFTT